MDIITLAKKVDKEEFKEALNYIRQVNDAGLILEFFNLVMEMEREGTDIMSCIHYSYYDLLIDSDTGKYKSEVKNLVTGSGGNYNF